MSKSTRGYQWRKMSEQERSECLADRKREHRPWHRPPHVKSERSNHYFLSAACFEHAPIIGTTPTRISKFEDELIESADGNGQIVAWVVLPNHYHILVQTTEFDELIHSFGQLHGRSSFRWNREDSKRGRTVFHGILDRYMRTEKHLQTTINYIHNNPVKHGYVDKWQDWPYSSVHEFFKNEDRDTSLERWERYPVLNYGDKWDFD